MLSLLHIENIAVIERADIDLADGLTVLTGETGAGKSIIIDAIGAIMGQRTSRELVRAGAAKGFVSAVFTDIAAELAAYLRENELEGDEPSAVHVQRQLSADGKTVCRVNMKPVSASVLKTISPYLINIHGQHDGQKLMDDSCHIDFLDRFAAAESVLERYQPMYYHLLDLKRQITALEKSEQERLQRVDMLTFHLEEIEEADLQPDEEETLTARKAFFDNVGQLASSLEAAYAALDGLEDSAGACELLTGVSDALGGVSEVSDVLRQMADRAEELKYLALDLRDSVGSQKSRLDFSPAEQAVVEQRLDTIFRLKQKYGDSVEAVLLYAEQAREELEGLASADEKRLALREEYRTLLAQARQTAQELGSLRREAAVQLEKRIVAELAELDMAKVRLSVKVDSGNKLTAKGLDTVSFLISVNPGEALRPLSKVASGGELSRVMLAMKNVLTEQEAVGTLIFDEIDTGVSGRAAQKIARKLASIGAKKQTLCVTHLPQIAAMGDQHMLIAKTVREERTFTNVEPVEGERRAAEIARMISGDQITEAAMKNACELLAGARAVRKGEAK